MEPRDRFLGPIATESGTDPDGPATVDFGDLVRKLILFDELVIESHNLKEPGPIAQKFGFHGAKALFESGRIRLVSDMVMIVDVGQAPVPHRSGFLPLGSYSISPARVTPPREYLSRQLHRVDDVAGLSSRQAQKLRHLIGTRLVNNPEDGLNSTREQIALDFQANPPMLKMSIAKAAKRNLKLELSPSDFALHLEPLGNGEWRAETDLGDQLTDLTARQIHDAVGQGLSAACTLNARLALMRDFVAISAFQVNDLPIFDEKLSFVVREINPDLQCERLARVCEVVGLPDVSSDPTVQDVEMAKLLEITSGPEVRDFRQWLRTTDTITNEDMADLVHPVREVVAKAARSPVTKAVRLATTTGVGIVIPPVGVGLSVLDTFLVDKMIPRPGPTAFLSRLSRSIFSV